MILQEHLISRKSPHAKTVSSAEHALMNKDQKPDLKNDLIKHLQHSSKFLQTLTVLQTTPNISRREVLKILA